MGLRLRSVNAQRNAGQLDVRLTEDQQNRGRSVARNRLLEYKVIDRPDLLVAVLFASRVRLGMVGAMMRMRRRMRVHESRPVPVTLVARRVDRVVRVSVRCGRKPVQECEHGNRGTKMAQHDRSIVSGACYPCQATTAGAPI